MGDELSEPSVETGTGMTVVPREPVMVLEVVAGPEVVLAGAAVAGVSSPEVLVSDTGAVPVDGAIPVEAVSTSVELVSDPTAGVLMTESVAAAEAALAVVKWLDKPESKEEAALDKMLENPDARDSVTAASVAVAATLESSEPSEEAKLDRAEDAASVIGAVVVAVGLPLASDRTDDSAEETALAKSEAADDTTLEATAVLEAASEEVGVESSVGAGMRTGTASVEVDVSVPLVVTAPSEDTVSVPSNSDAREPTRPGVAVLSGAVVDGTEVLLSVSGAVNDVSGIEALSAPEVASVKAAEDVAVELELPSIMVDRPTVIAPRDGDSEAPVSLGLSDVRVPVGAGSDEGRIPIVPMFASPVAERVEVTAVLAVGEGCSTGRPPV
jgi:hypothetical protein